MPDNKDFQNLSSEEKLFVFYEKSVVALRKLTNEGQNILPLVEGLDLPYHVFDKCRLLIEGTSEFLNKIVEFMEEQEPTISFPQDSERTPSDWILLTTRIEFTTKFESWKYYGQWLHNWFEERAALNLPSELSGWCKLAVSSVAEIQSLLAMLLNNSTNRPEHENEAIHNVNEEWQQREKARFPIFSQYKTYSAALKKTAQELSLSFLELAEVEDISPPSGYVIFSMPQRRANTRIQSNSSQQSFGEYIVTLQWRTNDRYQTWQGHSSIAKSLDDVVRVLHDWLVNHWDLTKIHQEYLWMQQAVIDSGLHPTWLPKNLKVKSRSIKPFVSTQNIYEVDGNPESKLMLAAFQGGKDRKQGVAQTKSQTVSILGTPAFYSHWRNEQKSTDNQPKNGDLGWSKNGITYTIHHTGIELDISDIIRIAESIRWEVMVPIRMV